MDFFKIKSGLTSQKVSRNKSVFTMSLLKYVFVSAFLEEKLTGFVGLVTYPEHS
jgi:hypothetical protein